MLVLQPKCRRRQTPFFHSTSGTQIENFLHALPLPKYNAQLPIVPRLHTTLCTKINSKITFIIVQEVLLRFSFLQVLLDQKHYVCLTLMADVNNNVSSTYE